MFRLTARRKPNIVFILGDDVGWHQLGCYGSDFYETPVLDRLAAQGMRFTDAYAAAPVCSPTRASLMTGKYPARLHLTDFIKGNSPLDRKLLVPDWTPYLPLKEVTVAEALKNAGYVCGHFGKWHLNRNKSYQPGRPQDPASQGFDSVLTTHKPGSGSESPYQNDRHHVRQITEHAIDFIEQNKDRPFFCYVSHNTIHRPEIEREELVQKYRNKPDADNDLEYGHNNPVQAAMLETLDTGVGRVLDKLEQLGLSRHTMVVFFGDNGHLGPKDCSPLRGSKADLYEGGIREPLIVRWPGHVRAGSTCDVPVISNDFFDTFCQMAGITSLPPDLDGVSLLGLLTGNGTIRREALYWHFPHYHHLGIAPSGAVRCGRYKLIEYFEKSADGMHTEGAFELYDLENDLNESNNLVHELPQVAADLYVKLQAWRKDVGAQQMELREI